MCNCPQHGGRLAYGDGPVFTGPADCAYCRDHGLTHDAEYGEGRYHYREASARLDLAQERGCFMRDIPDADVTQRLRETQGES